MKNLFCVGFADWANDFVVVYIALDVGMADVESDAFVVQTLGSLVVEECNDEILAVANVLRKVLTDDFDIGGQCLYVENSCCRTIVGYTYNDGGIVVVGDYAVGSEYWLDIGQRLHTRKDNGGKPYSEQRN